MSKQLRLFIVAVLFLLALAVMLLLRPSANGEAVVIINDTAVPPLPNLDPDRVARGEQIYARHCAACHGANLEGAPDWKRPLADGSYPPPPHDSSGHTWHHADALLLTIIAKGGQSVVADPAYKSQMPAFADKLSEEEMIAVLDFIKSKWEKEKREFQWWVTYTRGDEP